MEEIIKIENVEYYEDTYVLKNSPIYSKSARSSRDLVKKRNITEDNFIYARKNKNNYIKSSDKSPKFDRILFKKEFVLTIPEMKILIEGNKINNEEITDLKGIPMAPQILILSDNEKFKDNDGNIYNIETRGERQHDKIYFKVKDVENAFNLQHLYENIIDSRSNYKINTHYKFFIRVKIGNSKNKTDNKKELFLTYEGLLRVLFASNNNKTSKFLDWATKTLFTAQLGTKEQKD